jgi:hypothetical protein
VGNGEVEGKHCTAEGGKWGKSDLKTGPGTAQLECIRTYRSMFDRTRALHKWCKWLGVRTYRSKFDRKRA